MREEFNNRVPLSAIEQSKFGNQEVVSTLLQQIKSLDEKIVKQD